jgi:hypothetical protein
MDSDIRIEPENVPLAPNKSGTRFAGTPTRRASTHPPDHAAGTSHSANPLPWNFLPEILHQRVDMDQTIDFTGLGAIDT